MSVNLKSEPPTESFSWRLFLASLRSWWHCPALRLVLSCLGLCVLALLITFVWFYGKYSRLVDERIRRPIFNEPAQIYAAADRVAVGDTLTPATIMTELRGAGYVSVLDKVRSEVGTFSPHGVTLLISPGPASYHPQQRAAIHFTNGRVEAITDAQGQSLSSYELEPLLITGFFDAQQRSKRRLLTAEEIPSLVTNAIVSIEDRRFFEHGGINYVRLVEAC
jgi:penicillin-binding protein 1B